MVVFRHILRELRGPVAGLMVAALSMMLFASAFVGSARAAVSQGGSSHCLASGTGAPLSDPSSEDALCKVSCALGATALAFTLPSPPPSGLTRFATTSVSAVRDGEPLRVYRAQAGGSPRAPPVLDMTARAAAVSPAG